MRAAIWWAKKKFFSKKEKYFLYVLSHLQSFDQEEKIPLFESGILLTVSGVFLHAATGFFFPLVRKDILFLV